MDQSPDMNASSKRKENPITPTDANKRIRCFMTMGPIARMASEKSKQCDLCKQPMWHVEENTCHSCKGYIYVETGMNTVPSLFHL